MYLLHCFEMIPMNITIGPTFLCKYACRLTDPLASWELVSVRDKAGSDLFQ